jgi:hypothetical protein
MPFFRASSLQKPQRSFSSFSALMIEKALEGAHWKSSDNENI